MLRLNEFLIALFTIEFVLSFFICKFFSCLVLYSYYYKLLILPKIPVECRLSDVWCIYAFVVSWLVWVSRRVALAVSDGQRERFRFGFGFGEFVSILMRPHRTASYP